MKKYKLTEETLEINGHTLHRIVALRDFGEVKKGDLGGFIEKESNLAHNGNCWIYNDAVVSDFARVCNNAVIKNMSDYIVFKNWWSSGKYFTWTRSNDMWTVGCFYGTGEELIKKAYADNEEKGREYERVVKYVESIKQELK